MLLEPVVYRGQIGVGCVDAAKRVEVGEHVARRETGSWAAPRRHTRPPAPAHLILTTLP